MSSQNKKEYSFKISILGDYGVGKTSIITLMQYGSYKWEHYLTIGCDFFIKRYQFDNVIIALQLWDTASQEKYIKDLMPGFYRKSSGAILVFDKNNKQSFVNIQHWLQNLNKYSEVPNTQLVLFGHKINQDKQQISKQQGEKKAQRLGCKYFEGSTKYKENIQEMFKFLSQQLYKSLPQNQKLPSLSKQSIKKDNPNLYQLYCKII